MDHVFQGGKPFLQTLNITEVVKHELITSELVLTPCLMEALAVCFFLHIYHDHPRRLAKHAPEKKVQTC